jgi:hypothetical protein
MGDMRNGIVSAALLGSFLAAAPALAADLEHPPLAAAWRLDRFSVGGGVAAFAEASDPLAEMFLRGAWNPLPWVGLTGDLSMIEYLLVIPLAFSARVGPTLRPWSLAQGPVSPYVTAQVGLIQSWVPDTDQRVGQIWRAEAGLDVRLGRSLFVSVGGGLIGAISGGASGRFAQLVLGARS